ncbi:hypothetical protein BRADI_2g46471v3 [Brachypodium distachyon]|uniref:Uncharacterized protein n=1 Tax=Brachypodium distachyon TaxID=15368 RepID=A0A2K2DE50_BRADI|nr:hypothetical protein BRADI_2g46471v3 [Brachypodium distachyon]
MADTPYVAGIGVHMADGHTSITKSSPIAGEPEQGGRCRCAFTADRADRGQDMVDKYN